jgi:regulator of protease activity HflC (stomatin/prohibitin superfamily)
MNGKSLIWWIMGIVAVAASGVAGCVGCMKLEKVAPGHVGVSVRKCGDSGVKKDPIPTGYYWRDLLCEDVVTYPTSMQSLVLTSNPHEGKGGPDGKEEDQSITVTSIEGLPIHVDLAFNFTLDPSKVPAIYEKWRMDIDHIEHLYLRQTIREAAQDTFAQYTAQQLYSDKKETARAEVEAFLSKKLVSMGFIPAQLTLNRIEPPTSVVTAINAKVEMAQQAQKAVAEVQKKQAEASQAVAVAEGQAKSMQAVAAGEAASITLRAEAQAKANRILAESITPQLIEYQRANRWDGKLPSVTGAGAIPMMNMPIPTH